jgi:hypothetical protein
MPPNSPHTIAPGALAALALSARSLAAAPHDERAWRLRRLIADAARLAAADGVEPLSLAHDAWQAALDSHASIPPGQSGMPGAANVSGASSCPSPEAGGGAAAGATLTRRPAAPSSPSPSGVGHAPEHPPGFALRQHCR